ncbi:DUF4169 family protein [Rhodovulum sulfidophilum]|uniref:DUF4169 family protein n=1 Tax=Rhodovulum sulfidophilum TaxID=35806 RepID=A0ABS1RVB2_RHOSU|nr:DUF4169 family protein [Rhodovulum sulfidophilum]MBL3609807.1 DUF4169 family protein [Rhodovulum sulfidophilum]MCE8456863.1 DUF4169 family protein [Rhodovulum sulfidophilum]
MTGGVVNLRQARKARERAAKKAQGDENAARFGRTRGQKAREELDATRARDALDGHRRTPDDEA